MKSLQEFQEIRYEVEALAVFDGVERSVANPDKVIILLHGLNERGLRIYRKLINYLPPDAYVFAPNGPYPLPREKEDRTEYGYTWYFYDRKRQSYYIDQRVAVSWISRILHQKSLNHLPAYIIGFSQGGYLAPILGNAIAQTKLVIGLGCEFRENLIDPKTNFPLVGLHGEEDEVILPGHSQIQAKKLIEKGLNVQWEIIPETQHEISELMGKRVSTLLEKYGKDSL